MGMGIESLNSVLLIEATFKVGFRNGGSGRVDVVRPSK